MRHEVMPPERDQPHIMPLAQIVLDAVQPYAAQHKLDLASVLSAIGTATGAMIARAYSDPEVVDNVAARLSVAAREFAKVLIARDIRDGRRDAKAATKQ